MGSIFRHLLHSFGTTFVSDSTASRTRNLFSSVNSIGTSLPVWILTGLCLRVGSSDTRVSGHGVSEIGLTRRVARELILTRSFHFLVHTERACLQRSRAARICPIEREHENGQ